MKTIKNNLIEKISKIIQEGNLEDLDAIKQKISDVLDKETDVSEHPFYNPLLHEKHNTLEMVEARRWKYLKEFQAYVLATKDEYEVKTYGEAKKIAVEKLITELSMKIFKLSENSKMEAKLFLEIKLVIAFFKKYYAYSDPERYSSEFKELISVGLFCKAEHIRSFFYKEYCK